MAQITVDDQLIGAARSLVEGKGITDEQIINAALAGWVVRQKNLLEALEEARQIISEDPWETPFWEQGPNQRQPVWQP